MNAQENQFEADMDLERLIARQAMRLQLHPDPEERMAAFEELKRLHALRSPARIEQMEVEQGLR